ncbi:hemolysin XhlA family protein [Metaclostridioides mangenotii]|uniref:hemolysin XhlA family protein n=1 Tax=Metaclostridioides mangenotii TaxID=1540 RepID=UPI0028E8C14E|nr:hemolysin XhlA family protein [Clostridioides mangenotii]
MKRKRGRIDNHSERLDKLEQQQAAFAIQIETLCSDLKGLTGVLKWLVGVMITSLIGFFIYGPIWIN